MLCRRRIFWDVRLGSIDPEAHAAWVIVRVLTEGDWDDAKALFRLYGHKRIRDVVRATRDVPRERLALWSRYFGE